MTMLLPYALILIGVAAIWMVVIEWLPAVADADFRRQSLRLRHDIVCLAFEYGVPGNHPALLQMRRKLIGYGFLADRISLPFLVALRYIGRRLHRVPRAPAKDLSREAKGALTQIERASRELLAEHIVAKSRLLQVLFFALDAVPTSQPDRESRPHDCPSDTTEMTLKMPSPRVMMRPMKTAVSRTQTAAMSEGCLV